MAGLVRATESYYAGNHLVKAGEMLAEGDPKIVPMYVEEVQLPAAPAAPAAPEPAAEAEPAPKGKAKR